MAIITLNNNSLSSVTALPNGIVTAGALASGVGGKVLQVVQATDGTTFSHSSNSYGASGDIISITPASTSSKILIFFNYNVYRQGNNGNIFGTIFRDINGGGYSDIVGSGRGLHQSNGFVRAMDNTHNTPVLMNTSIQYLDSPNTTSQVNYQSYFRNESGTQSFEIGEGGGHTVAMQCIEFES